MNSAKTLEDSKLLQLLNESGHTKIFKSGEVIFRVDDEPEFLPIVIKGKVKVVRFLEVGKEIILNIFKDGDVFAIPPIYDGKEYPATAIALEETKLLLIYKKEFFELLDSSEKFSAFIISRMSSLMREIASSMENFATASPEIKVSKILLKLAEKENQNGSITINLRRQDIAEMVGLTTETTIRTVKKLADKELLKIVHGKILLEDLSALRKFCQS